MGWQAFAGSMTGRIFVLLLAGMALAGTAGVLLADTGREKALEALHRQRAADRVRLFLDSTDPAIPGIHPATADAAHGEIDGDLTRALAARLPGRTAVAFTAPLSTCWPAYAPPPPAIGNDDWRLRPPGCWLVLLDGTRRLTVETPMTVINERPMVDPLHLGILALAAILLSLPVARMASAASRRLGDAARTLGNDPDHPPLAEEGPAEVREAARAFNAMQARLRAHVAQRTHMLAAIAHDLQTPMTRLRLRLEKVVDAGLREQLLADLAEMRRLSQEGLDLARSTEGEEVPVRLDLDSLLDSLAADAVEAGQSVTFDGCPGLEVQVPAMALRRCLANLLDNAHRYAGAADIAVAVDDGTITIAILDRGPGIPDKRLAEVLLPFVRLEASRSRAGGGTGLGLTIADALARRCGSGLVLANRPGGGLSASLRLPLTADQRGGTMRARADAAAAR